MSARDRKCAASEGPERVGVHEACRTVSLPEAKARAFGGVETGRTKASEVVSVTGMSRYRGCTSIDCASVATTCEAKQEISRGRCMVVPPERRQITTRRAV
eukprot:54845-Pleurochrysis_carterae.AAC.1